jgi:hypothetical protein
MAVARASAYTERGSAVRAARHAALIAATSYNNLSGRKQIVTGPLSAREGPPDASKAIDAFLNEHIARQQAAKSARLS